MQAAKPKRPTPGPPSTRLVGRAREEAELERLVAALARGEGGGLVLSGPRGIGKSRLLTVLLRRAARIGARVVAADGTAPGRDVRYGVAASLLEPLLAELPAWQLRRIGGERLAMLQAVLAPSPSALLDEPPALPWRRHRIVRDLLRLAGDERPLLVAVDDLHAADPPTIELFSFLLRRAPVPNVALAVVLRPEAITAILHGSVYVGARAGWLIPVVPRPLAEHDVADLVDPSLDAASTRALHEVAGGVPARVVHLAAGGALGELLAAQWAELDGASVKLLEAGAVLGERFDLDVAAAVAGLDAAPALAALEVLAARGLVRTGARLREVTLVDASVREALAERAGRAVHREAAAALSRRAAPLTTLAPHVARGARRGDRDAAALLLAAATAVGGRTDDAIAWLSAARRLLPARAPADERAAVLVALAAVLARARRSDEARAALDAALALDDAALEAQRATIAEVLVALGDESPGIAAGARDRGVAPILREALARFDADGDMKVARATVGRDADPAPDAGDVAATWTFLYALEGELAAAAAQADVALAAWRALDGAARAGCVEVVRALGSGLALAERYAEAAEVLDRGSGSERLLAPLARVRHRQGRLDAAEAHVRDGLDATGDGGATVVRMEILTVAVAVALDRGHDDVALELAEAASALGRALPRSPHAPGAHAALASARLASGRPETAWALLPWLDAPATALQPAALALRARIELACGDLDGATETARAGRRRAEALGLKGARGTAVAVQAAIALARADHVAAVRLAVAAHRLHVAAGEPVAAARVLVVAADALAAQGDPAAAEHRLREAYALAFDAGAHGLCTATERALGRPGARTSVGVGPDQRAEAGAPLTRRERRIARLVGEGADNRAIAAQLHVSARTVERLVTNVRRKLAMPSRAALAAHVASRPDDFSA